MRRHSVMAVLAVLALVVGSAPADARQPSPPPPVMAEVNPYPPGAFYSFAATGYADIAQTITVLALPGHEAFVFWPMLFTLDDPGAPLTTAYLGPQLSGTDRKVRFSVWSATEAEPSATPGSSCQPFEQSGSGWTCTVDPFAFETGRAYELTVRLDRSDGLASPGAADAVPDDVWLLGSIRDTTTGTTTPIGRVRVAPTVRGVRNLFSFAEEFGPPLPSCARVPSASVRWDDPVAADGTVHATAVAATYGPNDSGTLGCGRGAGRGSESTRAGSAVVTTFRPAAMENDARDAAVVLPGASGAVGGSTRLATRESGEPAAVPWRRGGGSVWWSWTAPATGSLDVDLGGSDFDTRLGIYRVDDTGSLTRVGCDDDSGTGRTSRLRRLPVTSGSTYQIQVEGSGGASGLVTLRWSSRASAPDRHWPPAPGWVCRRHPGPG